MSGVPLQKSADLEKLRRAVINIGITQLRLMNHIQRLTIKTRGMNIGEVDDYDSAIRQLNEMFDRVNKTVEGLIGE